MNLREASMNLTEKEYREYPCLSYSAVARYDREGYECVNSLFDEISTPSLVFGSLVDCLLTQGEEAFEEQYVAANIEMPSETIGTVVNHIAETSEEKQFILVTDDEILNSANICEYQKNWKDVTRISKIRELGTSYYNFLKSTDDKKVVSALDVMDAKRAVEELKTDHLTAPYFNDSILTNKEHIYQLQLCSDGGPIKFKGMLDLVIIDHDNKTIIPVDLKTSRSIYSFEESFYKYRYYLQAAMYTDLLKHTIAMHCSELINYQIDYYRFIVIDRTQFKPIVFAWNQYRNLVVDKYGNIRKSYQEILEDLHWILRNTGLKIPYSWNRELTEHGYVNLKNYDENVRTSN